MGILSFLTWLPLVGSLLLLLVPGLTDRVVKIVAMSFATATFCVSLGLLSKFQAGTYHFQFVERVPWIKEFGVDYHLGVDGISIWLIVLTTFLMVISTAFSLYVKDRVRPYMAFLLMLETAMLGVFVSLDMIVFYTFFEASLIPMYFLISIWGGERRAYASIKFFLYTFAGSIFMLIGMIVLSQLHFLATGFRTFNIIEIQHQVAQGELWVNALQLQPFVFWAFAIAFLIKCPAFPFHTWLPDAHVEAPTAGSVILAGVLLKMGTYGFLRFCLPLFPDTLPSQIPILMGLAVVGIIYGAVVAAVQPDWKKLVAYSSVAHMGFVMLGIFSLSHNGLMGGAYQQLSHGISTGALFLLIGLIYERTHTRQFRDYGGLKAQMPIYATIFLIVMLSSVGLPGTNGFVGEFLAMLGAFEAANAGAFGLNLGYAIVAGFGVVLAAVYLLYMFQQVFYGPNANPTNHRLKDLKPWEIAMCLPLLILIFWGGLYPKTFLDPMEKTLGATRLMALAPEKARPTWKDPSLEIDREMNLVAVEGRTFEQIGQPVESGRVVAPAGIRFGTPQEATTTVAVKEGS